MLLSSLRIVHMAGRICMARSELEQTQRVPAQWQHTTEWQGSMTRVHSQMTDEDIQTLSHSIMQDERTHDKPRKWDSIRCHDVEAQPVQACSRWEPGSCARTDPLS